MASSKKFSRRRFLKRGAALASAGAAVPYFIPSGVLAAKGKQGANDRVHVGHIGCGRRAGQLVKGTNTPGGSGEMPGPDKMRVVAVADFYLKRAGQWADKYGCKAFQDYRKMLEMKDLDAVIYATPEHWHALPCIHACQAGKDIYGEQPLAHTIREGRAMVEAVRKYNRVFQTGEQQRSSRNVRLGCELIRNGRIGKVHTVIGHNYASPWECNFPKQPVPDGLDWDMWCGQNEVVPYHEDLYLPRANPGWMSFRPYSGGELVNWGAHGLSPVQWALGMDESGPVEVWTEGEPFDPPTYDEPESRKRGDAICSKPSVSFRYANGTVLKLADGPPSGGIFIGEKGKIAVVRFGLKTEPAEIAEEPIKSSDIHLYESDNHMQNWFDCIISRKRPIMDVEIGHRVAIICHLANIARRLGRKLRWDPEKETFPGDDEANKYLDCPKRKPYQLPNPV
jgi:predicted dehydrogenase